MFFIVHYDRAREQTHNKFARFYGHKLPCLQPSDSAIIEDLDRRTQNRMARGDPGDWETLGRVPISTAVDSLNGSRGWQQGAELMNCLFWVNISKQRAPKRSGASN